MTEATAQALTHAQCTDEQIEQYARLERDGRTQDCLRMLRRHRCELVEAMHEAQRPIDVVDWVIAGLERAYGGP